jgi:quinol-cytochrome oxidoreductase complex cytochrome b subunit
MRDVNGGWLLRYIHSNGASFFFIVLYIHIGRGLYYGSYIYPRRSLWCSGVIIFLITVITAFIGYVLPWGQMSFWGATVITNLASAIPFIGGSIVHWLWGGFSVGNATLNRFFSLHYLLPFVIAALSIVHLYLLHMVGSGNPLGINSKIDCLPFYPYSYIKDIYSLILFLLGFTIVLFFSPNLLGHSDNYIEANPMVTPVHIVPEWYFLPFYAILRAIPSKLGGVLVMVSSILIWVILPFYTFSSVRSGFFRPYYKLVFWLLVGNFVLLGWIGSKPVDYPYINIGQGLTFLYFFLFVVAIPFVEKLEMWLFSLDKK